MIRMTKLTDYGIALMTSLARTPVDERVTARGMAESLGLPHPTVSKLLKLLHQGGLLASTRGASGGYSLTRAPDEISLVEVVESLEGPLALTECAASEDCSCSLELRCGLRANWRWINEQLLDTLQGITLASMAGSLAAADRKTAASRG